MVLMDPLERSLGRRYARHIQGEKYPFSERLLDLIIDHSNPVQDMRLFFESFDSALSATRIYGSFQLIKPLIRGAFYGGTLVGGAAVFAQNHPGPMALTGACIGAAIDTTQYAIRFAYNFGRYEANKRRLKRIRRQTKAREN